MVSKLKKANFYTKSTILVNNLHPSLKPPLSSKYIRELVSQVVEGERCKLSELTINLVNDRNIKKINNSYLNHNYYTDIITFPYDNSKKNIDGEIFISLDTVKKNAKSYNTSFKTEFKRVIVHGCLHLTGYDDRTKKQKELIRAKENYYLSIDD